MAHEASAAITRRYTLDSLVARGACGEVFRGTDRETGATVAIKRLLPEHAPNSVVGVRFTREVKLLAQIESPHVVRYISHGHDENGRPCLVLEWLEGQDLSTRLQAGPLPVAEAIEVARQAALGLAALHAASIVHRDVKPSNFMIARAGVASGGEGRAPNALVDTDVKLIDLGIARAPADPVLTLQGSTIGTPAYMSPEQARGEENVTPRSDLFSLGSLLYELLSGRRPFGGHHPFVLLAKIVLEDPPKLSTLLPGISDRLDELVARAMAKSPDARFLSAEQMALALATVPSAGGIRPDQGDNPTQELHVERVSASAEQRVVTAVFALFRPGRDQPGVMQAFSELARESGAVTHRTLGGRMIAVFGAERSLGDEPVRAARVALKAVARLPGLRLAISTGRAVAGAAGLSGEAIERGARDLELARAAIRVDPATARMLSGQFVVEHEEGEPVLRGELGALEVSRTLLGKPTRCYGRDREIGTLDAIFRECVAEPMARAVLVTAPAGGGKSRVRYEFLRRLEERSHDLAPLEKPEILFGRSDPLGAGSPFAMIASAVRRAAGVLDGEPAARQAEKLYARVASSLKGNDLDRVAAFLGELVGVPFPDESNPALRAARRDPVLMGDSMREAWLEWLAAECALHPLLLVLEDMHWGDLPTIKFVDAALRSLRDAPLMVLALARPEVREQFPELWGERGMLEIDLCELSVKASTKLVRDVLGDAPSDETVRLIVERAQGNPFYLEELIRAVAEGKKDDLPDTVLGMVQARLDALGAEARRVLRAASVFGPTFYRGGVLALLGGDSTSTSVVDWLDGLVVQEVISRRPVARFPGETEYAFRHALVRDAAYAMLLDRDRSLAHRLAGEWLETTGESDPIVLAEHFDRGGEPARAVHWYRRGAEQALEGNDLGAVIQRADRGIALCAENEMLGGLQLLRAAALRWRGDPLLVERAAVDAINLLPQGSALWFTAVRDALVATGRLASTDQLLRWVELGSRATPESGAESAQSVAICQGVVSLLVNSQFDAADALFQRASKIPAELLDPGAVAAKRRAQAFLALFVNDLGDALRQFAASVADFERINDARNACLMRSNLGYLYCELGDYVRAVETLILARGAAERMGLEEINPATAQNLGYALANLGRLKEAREMEEMATRWYEERRDPRLECASRVYLSLIAYLENDFVAAEREARLATERVAATDPSRISPLGALARALLAQGRADEALAAARAALALTPSSDRYLEGEGLARLMLAESLERAGDHEAAVRAIVEAERRLKERARRISDASLRKSFLHRVPEHARTLELKKQWGVL